MADDHDIYARSVCDRLYVFVPFSSTAPDFLVSVFG